MNRKHCRLVSHKDIYILWRYVTVCYIMYYIKKNIKKKTGKKNIFYPQEDDSRKEVDSKYNVLQLTYTNYFLKAFHTLLENN